MREICMGFASNNLIRGWGNMGKKWEDYVFVVVGEVIDSWGLLALFPSFVHI